MIAALLLLAASPRLKVQVETPARPVIPQLGRRPAPRKLPPHTRTWTVRATLSIPF